MRFQNLIVLMLVLLAGRQPVAGQTGHSAIRSFPGMQIIEQQERFGMGKIAVPRLTPESFLQQHAKDLGLQQAANLRETRRTVAADGRTYLRYQQYQFGAPVLGGELLLQLNHQGLVQQLSGFLAAPSLFAPAAPPPSSSSSRLTDNELRFKARRAVLDDHPFALQWSVRDHGQAWTQRNPWSDVSTPYHLCHVLEVYEPAGALAEMVYLDATSGKVIFRHQLHCDLQRRLHHVNTGFGNIVWNEGDLLPGNLNDEDLEMITATEEVYSLFYRTFGRRSYNGTGGQMRAVTQAAISGCPNARAFNNIILACDGVVGDDIVGHEWTHNYTTELNGLLFHYESGSIQEGFSDIFGEAVDLLNNRGLDANDEQRRDSCFSNNYRWCLAEDAVAIDTILRDLWTPECKTDPATRTSQNFACPTPFGQDIHSNSLLVSRTFSLLTDGDTTSVDTVRGIGLTKALHIFYHANANYVTRVTDFRALAAMLQQSAQDLLGVNLKALTLINTVAPFSDELITQVDLLSLEAAIRATGLDQPSTCPTLPTLEQDPPSGCEEADQDNLAVLLSTDWEAGLDGWISEETPVHENTWDPKPWRLVNNLPDGRLGQGLFAPNAHVGNCQTDRDNGTVDLTSPPIDLPAEQVDFRLRFDHYYSIEAGTDGGIVSMSRNDEAFVQIPASAFIYNGYDESLDPAIINDNPLAGQLAFTGADANSLTGTWGTTLVDLQAAGVMPGDRIRLRWTMGHDGCDGWLGWYLDEVIIGYCGTALLPVNYLTLSAAGFKDRVEVNWATSSEDQNEGFFVERSSAGSAFLPLGFVAGGNSSYRFTDYEVVPGNRYTYRLRQVDTGGSEHLSELVTAQVYTTKSLTIYPNPTHGAFTIVSPGDEALIYDLSGQLIKRVIIPEGRVIVNGLRAGVYLVRARELVTRVVVQ